MMRRFAAIFMLCLIPFALTVALLTWNGTQTKINEKMNTNDKKTTEAYPANTECDESFSFKKIDDNIRNRIYGKSYKKNNHIALEDLRYITIKYYGFDGKSKYGELISHKKIAQDLVEIFYELYQQKYPIERVSLIDNYDADDIRSMEANNSSAFNYRMIAGTQKLSRHAMGVAVDINPRINPHVTGITVSPSNGVEYVQRDVKKCKGKYKSYMIQKDDYIYKLFKAHGFTWGGDWESSKDYQHFEKEI